MSLLDHRLLQAFIAVADERHFGRAAARLHLSQPPVTQRIRQLEESLGVALFVRTTRQVRLTPAGEELYKRAQHLIHQALAAEASVKRLGQGETGTLRLGFTRTVGSHLLPKLLAYLRQHTPHVGLQLQEDWSARLIDMLRSELLDIAVLRYSHDQSEQGLTFTLINREPLRLAVPRNHRLSGKKKVKLHVLEGETLVGYSASTANYFHRVLHDVLQHYGVSPSLAHESAIPTVLTLVEAGMGVALVPESAAAARPRGVSILHLHDPLDCANVELYAATREGSENALITGVIGALYQLTSRAQLDT